MRTFLTLNLGGTLSAFLLGAALVYLGIASKFGLLLIAVMLYFLLLSTLVTGTGRSRKERMGVYERGRGWKNVFANGIVPVITAILLVCAGSGALRTPLLVAYVASIAAITADKFASEVGILDGQPTMLLTMKPARRGQSGGVTVAGTAASLAGAFLISASLLAFSVPIIYIAAAGAAGFLGSFVDSLLGYFEEHRIGNKYTSNIACAAAGAALALLVIVIRL